MKRLAAVALALPLAGCQPEERIINYKPFLSGLENVQTATPAVRSGPGIIDPTVVPDQRIRIENEDGSVTLIAKSAAHLITHIQQTLESDEEALFVEQVLSDVTRQEFYDRGLDPSEAFRRLTADREDIARLFARMPMGEHTPQVIVQNLGAKTHRVKLTGAAVKGVGRYRGFDMVMERGNWKLRWFWSG